jgi:hypothetical protein
LNNNPIPVLNMLNTKYIILNPGAPPLINSNALGNAWFVANIVIVPDANKEIAAVRVLNPANEAVVDDIFKDMIPKAAFPKMENEKIELVSYKPDELIYKSSATEAKPAVFSEIYYPKGWKCFIDGKESSYFRTNYVLRGMIVPAGDHEIKFVFSPDSYVVGNKISLASSVLLILIAAGYIIAKIKGKIKAE